MTTADFAQFQVGNAQFPMATPGGSATLLQLADPTVFHALAYWTAMLNTHLGAAVVAAFAAAGVTTAQGSVTAAVMNPVPYDPTVYLPSTQQNFPMLGVYRKSVRTEWNERGFERDLSTIGATYVLPPLTAGQAEQLMPLLGAVYKILRARTSAGFDPSYTPPGGTVPANPWGPLFANAERMGVDSAQYGELAGEGNLHFPALVLTASFYERDNPPTQATLNPFQGANVTTAMLSDDGVTSLATPAQVVGTTDGTQTALYGATGTLNGLTLILNVNGAGALTLALSGTGNATSATALLAAITAKWPALAAYSGNVAGFLGLLDAVVGAGSTIVVGAGTANTALGLTPGTYAGQLGLQPVTQQNTQLAPTLTSVSPSTGTFQGGTAVTLTGSAFSTAWQAAGTTGAPKVLFGSLLATSVVVVNATTITCVTPASSGNGSVSVSVFNGDGQFADVPAAFTYTSP